MRLQFVYKNTGKIFNVVEGATISMSYNEDLSHGTIILRENYEIEIESNDEIILLDLDYIDKLYMLVWDYEMEETRNRNGDKVYTYIISIISQTKLLENINLPSLAITPKTNGGLKIIDYLNRYNDLYGQKVRTATGFANKFRFDVGNKFDDVCPELQFNKPTFRECLTQLMMVKDCIPIVQNNVISYIDLSSKKSFRNKDNYFVNRTNGQKGEDYISSLHINMKNVISQEIVTNSDLNGRCETSAMVSSNNVAMYAQKPIYEIKQATLHFFCYLNNIRYGETRPILPEIPEGDSVETIDCDITELLLEKSKWDTLNVAENTVFIPYDQYKNYRNTTIYYTRGSNAIENLNASNRDFWWYNLSTLRLLTRYGAKKFFDQFAAKWPGVTGSWEVPEDIDGYKYFENVFISIKYITKDDSIAKVGKTKNNSTYREVVDNQSENYLNAYTQGLLEYAKANRLGNKMNTYTYRYPRNYSELPVIGDYFEGNEIIYKIDYQIYNECVNATIHTCPNYVLRNYFTGVQSKLRSWKIVDGNEAFYREDNKKIYIEFSKDKYLEKNFSNYYTFGDDYKKVFLQNLIGSSQVGFSTYQLCGVGYCFFKNGESRYDIPTSTNVCGNSIIATFGFNDNYIVGRYISQRGATGGNLQNLYKYCDENGELEKIYFALTGTITSEFDTFEYGEVSGGNWGIEEGKNYWKEQCNINSAYPKTNVSYSSYGWIKSTGLPYYKDNKEIPKITFQFEYCSDTNDVAFAKRWVKSRYYTETKYNSNLVIMVYDGNVVNYADPETLPTGGAELNISNLESSVEDITCFKIHINNVDNNKTCFIYDKVNKEVIISFYGNTIYMNLLLDRNKNIYTRFGDDLNIVGTIKE